MQRGQFIVNPLEKLDVDRSIALGQNLRPGASHAQIEGFVRANMQKRRRKLLGNLRKPVLDERQRPRLPRSQHMTVGRLGRILVQIVLQHLVKMPKRLLLGHNRDVIPARIRHQLRRFGRRERAARRRGQRLIRIEQRVLEVGRIDIDLESGEDPDLMLLKLQRGKRPAREIVVDAAILHRRPVAHRARGQNPLGAGERQQLL